MGKCSKKELFHSVQGRTYIVMQFNNTPKLNLIPLRLFCKSVIRGACLVQAIFEAIGLTPGEKRVT